MFLSCLSCTKNENPENESPSAPNEIECSLPNFVFQGSTSLAMFSCDRMQSVPLSITVNDKENDPIIYKWKCSAGYFDFDVTNKSNVVWIAPDETSNCLSDGLIKDQYQLCEIWVAINDPSHSSKKYSIDMYVNCNSQIVGSPIITSVPTTSSISGTSIIIQAKIDSDNGYSITSRGVCYNTSGSPTIDDYVVENGSGTGLFTTTLTDLTANTKYYAKVYGTNSIGTSYSSEINFTTNSNTNTSSFSITYDGTDYDFKYVVYDNSLNGSITASISKGNYPSIQIFLPFLNETGTFILDKNCVFEAYEIFFLDANNSEHYNMYECPSAAAAYIHNGKIVISSVSGRNISGSFSANLYPEFFTYTSNPKKISGVFNIVTP